MSVKIFTLIIALCIYSSFGAANAQVGIGANITSPDELSDQQTFNTWILTQARGDFDSSDAGNAYDVQYDRTRIEVTLESGVSILFNCITLDREKEQARFQAAINLDTSKEKFERNLRRQHISGRLTVGDRQKAYRWQWNPSNMMVAPTKEEASRRMFNGVIKGEKITLRIMGANYIEQALPAPNSAFKTFFKTCKAISG